MRAANTRYLLVDVRRCPGGSSLAALILEYFLYGIDGMVEVNDGYQIPRYSRSTSPSTSPILQKNRHDIERCLENGGYDFSGERAWEERQRTGLTQAARDQRLREIRELTAQMPTFAALVAESEWREPGLLGVCSDLGSHRECWLRCGRPADAPRCAGRGRPFWPGADLLHRRSAVYPGSLGTLRNGGAQVE